MSMRETGEEGRGGRGGKGREGDGRGGEGREEAQREGGLIFKESHKISKYILCSRFDGLSHVYILLERKL